MLNVLGTEWDRDSSTAEGLSLPLMFLLELGCSGILIAWRLHPVAVANFMFIPGSESDVTLGNEFDKSGC